MEDRIDSKVSKETIYKFLNTICNLLIQKGRSEKFYYRREGTYDGMRIVVYSTTTDKILKIDSDLKKNIINLYFHNYCFATLYKDNSISCSNFLKQIWAEQNEINTLLNEMLRELDSMGKPIVEKTKPTKKNWFSFLKPCFLFK